jgi:PII-like signaling protein
MQLNGEAMLLRIYIGESDQWHRKPLYQELVRAARRHGLAGATVLRGIEGSGRPRASTPVASCRCPKTCPWSSRSWTARTR